MKSLEKGSLLAYAIILFIGGAIGYVKSGSTISLIAGTASGILILAAFWAMLNQYAWGKPAAITITLLLSLFFGYRLILTGAFMPPGLMLIVGLLTLVSQCPRLNARENTP